MTTEARYGGEDANTDHERCVEDDERDRQHDEQSQATDHDARFPAAGDQAGAEAVTITASVCINTAPITVLIDSTTHGIKAVSNLVRWLLRHAARSVEARTPAYIADAG